MALADGQFSYRGLVFGDGTDYQLDSAEGFEGFDIRTSDSDAPRGDGAIRGLDYVAARLVAFQVALIEMEDLDGSIYEGRWANLRATFLPSRDDDQALTFKRAGQPERQIRCRPIQLTRTEGWGQFNRFGHAPIVLRASDPRLYSSTEYTQNVQVYSASRGGADFGFNYGVDFTGGVQRELVAINGGNTEAYPLIRFYGPVTGTCTGVVMTNTTNGDVLEIDTSMVTGQLLQADMRAAVTGEDTLIISLDGTSRYGSWQLPRSAFRLAPGSNTVRLQVVGTSTDVVANVTWRDTWMS